MWQRFTERARRVVFFAQEEAARLGENYVSTEHLLLGMVREDDSVASRILEELGVSRARVRSEVERQVAKGDGRMGPEMQLTPRGKRVVDLAYDEARQFGNNYIGTEHLLLGLIREGEGLAGRVLTKLGVDLERARAVVTALQNQVPGQPTPARGPVSLPGDLGVLRPPDGQGCLAFRTADAQELEWLKTVLVARDAVGYRELAAQGKIIVLAAETAAKLLRCDGGPEPFWLVRVIDGPHSGGAVWINRARWERTGPDEAPFPPDIEL